MANNSAFLTDVVIRAEAVCAYAASIPCGPISGVYTTITGINNTHGGAMLSALADCGVIEILATFLPQDRPTDGRQRMVQIIMHFAKADDEPTLRRLLHVVRGLAATPHARQALLEAEVQARLRPCLDRPSLAEEAAAVLQLFA